jgi:hypothetical protein
MAKKESPTEYGGDRVLPNAVQGLGPLGRELSSSEKLRLGYRTGQEEDPEALKKSGFFYGVDPDYPEKNFNWDSSVAPKAGD